MQLTVSVQQAHLYQYSSYLAHPGFLRACIDTESLVMRLVVTTARWPTAAEQYSTKTIYLQYIYPQIPWTQPDKYY